jgi:hypothetical protein
MGVFIRDILVFEEIFIQKTEATSGSNRRIMMDSLSQLLQLMAINGHMDKESLAHTVVLLLVAAFFIIFSDPLQAVEWKTLQQREVIILFEDSLEIAAEEVAFLYPGVKQGLEKIFALPVNFIPTIFLIGGGQTFQGMAGSDLVVAFATPSRNQIVIDYSKMKTQPFTLETTLKHELCHLLLHHHIKRVNLPRWLDEGICQWVSDGIAEIILEQGKSVLDEAVLSGRYLSIRSLEERFPQEKRLHLLAYEESKSLVEYMMSSYGEEKVLSVIHDLEEGAGVDVAILEGLSISLSDLEIEWHQHLKRRSIWLVYLANHLYEILFFLGALAIIYGFIRQIKKKREYQEEEEDWG